MSAFTLHDLQCFNAVILAGGFQAAASRLNRSHPAVFAAVGKLEKQLGFSLLDRNGYKVKPTQAGLDFNQRAQLLLQEAERLSLHASQLAMGTETELRIVLGDFCPRPVLLAWLSDFFAGHAATRLSLYFEAVSGPEERLHDEQADLIFHQVNTNDTRLEWLSLGRIQFVPVAAPGFLPFAVTADIRPQQMQHLTQCVIRDTANHSPPNDHFLVPGAPRCSVADHLMKKEVILHGLAWGHLPRYLVEDEIRQGKLHLLSGDFLQGSHEQLVVARRSDRPVGPVASALWECLKMQRSVLVSALSL
ncbi:LysR family transcriptional regulator [Bowmanella denitrificans]|uniref:LysR family transcriptional regulator n=1 Tax=Bowmanella denitrificans TaxID=366582 RepID=A0ABP3HPX3_9ALTE